MPFRIRVTLIVLGLVAAAVLVLPLVWPVPPLEDTRDPAALAGPDAAWIDAEGARLHARIRTPAGTGAGGDEAEGAAPAFVFVHGYASGLAAFGPLQEALARRAPTIAYDRPGFGLSERPLDRTGRGPYGHEAQVAHVLDAMDRLGAERAVLVGSSAGGAIALRTALAHPARVAGLVLLAPEVERPAGVAPALRPLLGAPQFERIGPLLMRRLGGEAGESLLRAAYADPERVPPEVLEAHRRATSVDDWDRALWEVTRAGRAPEIADRLAEVSVPTLVLAGTEDPVVPPEATERVAAAIPGARFEALPGCGHLPHAECPSATRERITAWLAEAGRAVADAP